MPYDTLVRGGKVVLAGHGVHEVDLAIEGEQIAAILTPGTAVATRTIIEARGLHVLPGALDSHTHWGYRGDFGVQCASDSRAAPIGGVTTALLLQRIEPGQFPELKQVAVQRSTIDFVFSPAIFSEPTAASIEEAIERWGCPSFKFYLAYRRLPGAPPGDDWNELTEGLMLEALERMARYDGTLACVHAENAEINNRGIARVRASGRDGLAAWEEANPPIAEVEAIQRAGLYAERTGMPVHFVHLSGRDAVTALDGVKAHWPKSYGETCPHYLFHNVETSPAAVKFSPPVRHRQDNEALWDALASGRLDCVGSDNAPTLWAAKQGTVWDIVRGGPGAGVLLPLILSEGVNKGRLSLERAVEVTSTNAAHIFGLHPRKGTIQVDADADLALVDLGLEKTVSQELFGTWSDYTLYTGIRLKGWPVITMVRGRVVAENLETLEVGFPHLPYVSRPVPRSGLEGKFSVQYAMAVALLDGRVVIDSFSDRRRFSADVEALLPKIHVVFDDATPVDFAETYVIARAVLRGGATVAVRVDHPRGMWVRPLTPAERTEKFFDCAERVLGRARSEGLRDLVDQLDTLPDVAELADAAMRPPGP